MNERGNGLRGAVAGLLTAIAVGMLASSLGRHPDIEGWVRFAVFATLAGYWWRR